MSINVVSFDMAGPGDASGLAAALAAHPSAVRAVVFAKTEGHAGPNDFSRDLARSALSKALADAELARQSTVMLAIGCEGVSTPCGYALIETPDTEDMCQCDPDHSALVMGTAVSIAPPAEEIGTPALVDRVAATVQAAMQDAGLSRQDTVLVLVKGPVLPPRHPLANPHRTNGSRGRAVAALGVGVALGEVERERVTMESIATDLSLYTRRAMTFAGPELDRIEAVAFGNKAGAPGCLRICATLTRDILDAASIKRMMVGQGFTLDDAGELTQLDRINAVFAKCGVAPDGRLRDGRTTVFTSSLLPEMHMRATESGVLGSIFGTTRYFISGDPVQHSTPGGGVAAAIYRIPSC
jgi:cyanuric acid amidohydrolase